MRITDRYFQLLTLTLRVQRELDGIRRRRAPLQMGRAWRLRHLHQRLRATIRDRMTHPLRLA